MLEGARQMTMEVLRSLKAMALAALGPKPQAPAAAAAPQQQQPGDLKTLESAIADREAMLRDTEGSTLREQCRFATELVSLLTRKVEALGGTAAAGPQASSSLEVHERGRISRAAEASAQQAVSFFEQRVHESLGALGQGNAEELRQRHAAQQQRADAALAEQERALLAEMSQLQGRLRALERQLEAVRHQRAGLQGDRRQQHQQHAVQDAEAVLARHQERLSTAAALRDAVGRAAAELAGVGPAAADGSAAASHGLSEAIDQLVEALGMSLTKRQAQLEEIGKALEWSAERLLRARDSAERAASIGQAAVERQQKQVADLERRLQELARAGNDCKGVCDQMAATALRLMSGARISMQQRAALNRLLQTGEAIAAQHRHLSDISTRALDPANIIVAPVTPGTMTVAASTAHLCLRCLTACESLLPTAGNSGISPLPSPGPVPSGLSAAAPGGARSVDERLQELERQLKLKEMRAAAGLPEPVDSVPSPADQPQMQHGKERRPSTARTPKENGELPGSAAKPEGNGRARKGHAGDAKGAASPAPKPSENQGQQEQQQRKTPAQPAPAAAGPSKNPWGPRPEDQASSSATNGDFPSLGESVGKAGPSSKGHKGK